MAEDVLSVLISGGDPPASPGKPGGGAHSDVTIDIDLASSGRAVPAIIIIVVRIVGTCAVDMRGGMTRAPEDALLDVTGGSLVGVATSGAYWVPTEGIRFIRFIVDSTDEGTFAYYLVM